MEKYKDKQAYIDIRINVINKGLDTAKFFLYKNTENISKTPNNTTVKTIITYILSIDITYNTGIQIININLYYIYIENTNNYSHLKLIIFYSL